MRTISLSDIDLLDVGNTVQLYGAMYSDGLEMYYLPMPDECPSDISSLAANVLVMNPGEWATFLLQSDVLDVQGPEKAILRKSQRQIDQNISWVVYTRDGYLCRYCGCRVPLTVDHVILWEEGGQSVASNLVSSCRRCNKLRGSTEYAAWIASEDYRKVSKNLSGGLRLQNELLIADLPELRKAARPDRLRSR